MPLIRMRQRLAPLSGLLFLLLAHYAIAAGSDLGQPAQQFIDMRQSGSNQTGLCIAQAADGTLYFGGGEAILSFDGEDWTRHPTRSASLAQALGTDRKDRLWVAGCNVLGWFERSHGRLSTFHSLLDHMPERLRSSFNIWYMFPRDHDVIFVEESAVLRWDGREMKEWTMPDSVRLTAMRDKGEIYIHHRSTGLWRFGEARPELLMPKEQVGRNGILWVERRDEKWLLVTGNGIRLVDDSGQSSPCPAADEHITRNFLASASHPPGFPLLVATISGGLVGISDDWTLRPLLDTERGAPTNAAFHSFVDQQGALWVGFDEGVVRLGQPGLTRQLGAAQGLGKRSAVDLQMDESVLTVATQDGILRLDTRPPRAQFTRLEGHDNYYLRLLSRDGLRLAIGFSAIERLGPGGPLRIHKARAKMEDAVLSRRHPGLLYYVDGDGLYAQPIATDSAAASTRIATMHEGIICLLEDSEGGLWAAGEAKGVTHVPASGEGPSGFGQARVLLNDRRVRLGKAGAHLVAVTDAGGYRYDPGRRELVSIPGLPRQQVLTCSVTGEANSVWIAYESPFASGTRVPVLGILRMDDQGDSAWQPCTIDGLGDIGTIRSLLQDQEGILWVGGGTGILRIDTRLLPKDTPAPLPPLVRANIQGDDQIPARGGPVLVHLATTEYGHRDSLRFQTRLDGVETDWSAPGNNPDLSFAGLREGDYTLRARVLADSGLVSPERSLHFVILPPWWRSPTALALWCLLLLGTAFMLPWGYSRYLRGQNRRLNELVRLRTLELERSATAKVEFVRALSHELRNPIAGASLMAELVQGGARGGTLEEQATKLRGCIHYLETLLDGALDLTQAESGRAALRVEPFTPEGLLRDAAAIFGPLARRKGLDFTLDAGTEPAQPLLGDLIQTERILVNYLSNAFKFTTQGSIRVRARLSPPEDGIRRLRLEVEDSGRGISPLIQSRLFKEFIREGTRTEAGEKTGAGLGLALCRRLASLAGGSVGFSSEEGRGSVFWTELPFIIGAGPSPEASEDPLPAADFSSLDVCLVDDDPLHMDALYATLEQFGIVAVRASSAEEAKLILKTKDFAVVMLDYSLGSTTGLQLLTELRANRSLRPQTHYHLVTGMLDVELTREATEAGFQGSHRKPLSSVALFRILKAASKA